MIRKYIASVLVDPAVLGEKAPIQFVNATSGFNIPFDQRVTSMFDPTGLQLADPVGHYAVAQTVILDYSGGKFPLTTQWLANYFGAPASGATPTVPAPASGQQTYGLVVLIGNDFGRRWVGR
jgi:hypothetical protein